MEDMRRMRKDNQVLWSESFTARDRHLKQSQTLEKIMKFLAAVYGNSAGKIFEVGDNDYDHLQMSAYKNATATPSFAASATSPAPLSKPRLMLMDQAYRKPSTSSQSPSMASAGKESVEEITRNTPGMQNTPESSANANRIYQQIMNPELAGVSSPSQFFPELNGSYFNTNQRQQENSGGAYQPQEEQLQGLEDNIVKQGQALLQVQDWIQALANRQQQQQEQIHQQQQSQRSQENLPAGESLGEFDVDEFLDNNGLNVSQSNLLPRVDSSSLEHTHNTGPKRVIQEVESDEIQIPKRKKT